MLTTQERQIAEAGKAQGLSREEILEGISKYRAETKNYGPVPPVAEPDFRSRGAKIMDAGKGFIKDAAGDFEDIGEDAIEQFGKAGENINNVVEDKEKGLTDKILGVGSEAFRRGGRFIGSTYLNLAKMVLPQSWEDKIKVAAQGTAEEVKKNHQEFMEENKDDPAVQRFQAVIEKYKTDPDFKQQVDNASGFIEGLGEIVGAKKITPGVDVVDAVKNVRKLEPEFDVPYFKEIEKAVSGGIDNLRKSKTSKIDEISPDGDSGPMKKMTQKIIDKAVETGQKTVQKYQDLKEGVTERIGQNLDRQALDDNRAKTPDEVESNIGQMYINAVSPGVKGKKQTVEGFNDNRNMAVKGVGNITKNKKDLKFRDLETNEFIEGELPTNLWEFGSAITNRKTEVYRQVLESIGEAADQPVDANRIVDAMEEIVEDPIYAGFPQIQSRAKAALNQYMMNDYTPMQIERLIQLENDRLQAFYRGNGTQADAVVSAIIVNNLRDLLDEAVEAAGGEAVRDLKKEYGALKSIERDVVHRGIHNAQARKAGLIDMANIRTIGDFAQGMSGDLSALQRSAAQIAGQGFIKALNDRDAMIRRMFLVADQLYSNAEPVPLQK